MVWTWTHNFSDLEHLDYGLDLTKVWTWVALNARMSRPWIFWTHDVRSKFWTWVLCVWDVLDRDLLRSGTSTWIAYPVVNSQPNNAGHFAPAWTEFVFQVRAIFFFYIDSNLRFDKVNWRSASWTPIRPSWWSYRTYEQLTTYDAVPGGYYFYSRVYLDVGGSYHLAIQIESCGTTTEVLQLSVANTPYTGSPYL